MSAWGAETEAGRTPEILLFDREILEERAYWLNRLSARGDTATLPGDSPASRPGAMAAAADFNLNPALSASLGKLTRGSSFLLFAALLAALKALLHRYTGQRTITVGTPARRLEDGSSPAANGLAIVDEVGGHLPFRELLLAVRQSLLDAYARQRYPISRLIHDLGGDASGGPALFQFTLASPDLHGPLPDCGQEVDIVFENREGGLGGTVVSRRGVFAGTTLQRMAQHLLNLLSGALAETGRPLRALPLLSPAERAQLLTDWNETAAELPETLCIHSLVEAQAARSPEALAVADPRRRLTYRELDAAAARLVTRLLAAGVAPGDRVGLLTDPSVDLVTGALAVLKTGGAYVPLDPAYPAERLAFMLADSSVSVLLCSSRLAGQAPAGVATVVPLDDEPAGEAPPPPRVAVHPRDLAYVIYTSGSTGQPKGVAVEHRSLVNLAVWHQRAYDVTVADRATQLAGPAFDASVWELWPYLISGASLHVVPADIRLSAAQLAGWLAAQGITVAFLPTPIAELALAETWPPETRLRLLLTGGDRLHRAPRPGLPFAVVNHYGPTEGTVVATRCVVPPASGTTPPPIGRPIGNVRAYLLDAAGEPVPVGIPGELHIAGTGLARGYLDRPGLTAERFVPHPFASEPGERLYRTGDLTRYRPDGDIEFLGRTDDQVKVRGYRIELGEIEASLASHPQVREASVILREDRPGERRLVAYLVAERNGDGLVRDLRAHLLKSLPAFLVPAAFVPLAVLPLTPNGKVDRRALPEPSMKGSEQEAGDAPRTWVEEVVADIFGEILKARHVGSQANFFDLGGHSLLATQAMSRVRDIFHVELPLRALFENPTVGAMAERVEEALGRGDQLATSPLVAQTGAGLRPLSFAQERLWFLDQLEPLSPAYNIPVALRLEGRLDVALLERCLTEVVRRHESLRTVFETVEGRPTQGVRPATRQRVPEIDLSGLSAGERQRQVRRLIREEALRPFILSLDPLTRASLLRLQPGEQILLFTMHHIVSDGWSIGVLVREVKALYEAFSAGEPSPLPPLPIQYSDFAVWQRRWLSGEILAAQLGYWKEALAGAPGSLEIPADRPRPAVQSYRGMRWPFRLPAGLADGLRALGRQESATLFMTLLAAFQTLLARWSGAEDLVVGTPIANRNRSEIEPLIGFFVNTLALRTDLFGDPAFQQLLVRVRESALGAYAYQDLPFEKLVAEMDVRRDLTRQPLFQVMFVLQNAPEERLELPGLRMSLVEIAAGNANFDLDLTMTEEGGELFGSLQFATDLWDAASAGRLTRQLAALLAGVAADRSSHLSQLSLLDEAERHQIRLEWNATAAPFPTGLCIHELFERRAALSPTAPAVVADGERLSYGELNARANRLARLLRRLGVGPEVRVGIRLEKSLDLIVSVLAVLKAGGCYVPILGPTDGAAVKVLITLDDGAGVAPGAPRVPPRDPALDGETSGDLGRQALPENLAYVLYTSGSTGSPKGVMVEHRSLVNAYLAWEESYALREAPGPHLQMASFSFDVFAGDFVRALCSGGSLVLCDRETMLEPDRLYELMTRERIEVAEFVPAVVRGLASLLETSGLRLDTMRLMIVGSDIWYVEELRALARLCGERTRLINSYGITETTIDTTFFELRQGAETGLAGATMVPIGRPFANSEVHLLDPGLTLVPLGIPGELYIGGSGLSRGYLDSPDLTASRFVPDPWAAEPGARLYRSGDRARRLPDGNIELLGRLDHQVKVRGMRIELGEIEAALAEHPEVDQAVVLAREARPGEQRLAAYVVPAAEGNPSPEELLRFLRTRLSDAKIPSAFVRLSQFPLTPHGKVDRRALPAPAAADLVHGEEAPAPPRTPVEEVLCNTFAAVLGRNRIGVADDFFALGGHSLMATQLVSRLRRVFGMELPVRALFEEPTPAGLARRVEEILQSGGKAAVPPLVAVPRDGALPLSFAQERLWFLHQLNPGSPAYNMPIALRLRGPLDAGLLSRTLSEVVRRHEGLRTTFQEIDGRPVQVVGPAVGIAIPEVDLSLLPGPEQESASRRLAREEAVRPFDLSRGPLLRIVLLRLAAEDWVALFNLHHVVSDGWSQGVLVREVEALYGAFAAGLPSPLPKLPVQYADFAVWQREWLQGPPLEEQIAWWRERLRGAGEGARLLGDRPRPAVQRFRGALHRFTIGPALAQAVRSLAVEEGATLFMTLLAAFQALLQRDTGEEDVTVGSPIANRGHAEIEGLIGFFVNSLVMRCDLPAGRTFGEHLARVREMALGAYAHQDLPFEMLVEILRPERSLSFNPLFQLVFALQNAPLPALSLPGLTLEMLDNPGGTTRWDLELHVSESDAGLSGMLVYDVDLFDPATMQRLIHRFERLLAAAVAAPGCPVDDLPWMDGAERAQLVHEWNDTRLDLPAAAPVHWLFAARAAADPAAIALAQGGETWTYGELDARSNQLAHHLRGLGVGPEEVVGVFLERSPEWVASLLAVLKAGGAYLTLEPSQPDRRLAAMLEDAGVSVVVTLQGLAGRLDGGRTVLCLDADREALARNDASAPPAGEDFLEALAYVIFTSGSTGRPKGVAVTHASLANLALWHIHRYGITAADRASQVASGAFDAAVWEIWPYLATGASLHIIDDETRNSPADLLGRLAAAGIGISFLPTPLAEAVLVEPWPPGLRLRALLTGGDRLHAAPSRELPFRLVNHYGPTESTVVTTCGEVAAGGAVTLGRPIANLRAYLLDGTLRPVPLGAPGELWVGGEGVARGYLGRPDLTAERFLPDPWTAAPGARLYRTGDLARHGATGEIEFLGRVDHQLKLRGFRIEPGEIEAALREHPAVQSCAVAVREDRAGQPQLVAYVVPDEDAGASLDDPVEEHIADWQKLYDETYSEGEDAEVSLNLSGWNSSYTGEPIPEAEMREWVERTVEEILALRPEQVLEIGCGTGLLLQRLAPHCRRYHATDFSATVLDWLRGRLRELPQVTLERRLADDLSGLETAGFDCVVLNSTVQYFPSVDYLRRVVAGAVERVRDGGHVFVGDVRSQPLLDAFYASIELFSAAEHWSLERLRQQVQARRLMEGELVIDPAFFLALERELPRVARVEIRPKRGRAANELTCFRYQAVLHVGPPAPPARPVAWTPWQREGLSLASVRRLLSDPGRETLALEAVPSSRTAGAAAAAHLLASGADEGCPTAGELRQLVRRAESAGVDPEDLRQAGSGLGFEVALSWARGDREGRYEAVFWRPGSLDPGELRFPAPSPAVGDWARFGTNPLRNKLSRLLVPELRLHLREKLPDAMVPPVFVLLDELPLNTSGKVDRRALPAPGPASAGGQMVAPRTRLESAIERIFAEVLTVDRVSVEDDFFALGGHSLLATQVTSRIARQLGAEILLRTLFESPTVAALASQVEAALREGLAERLPPLRPRRDVEAPPLSFAQQRVFFLTRLDPESSFYNVPVAFRVRGRLDAPALAAALTEIARRHHVLRTRYVPVDGEPRQRVEPAGPVPIPQIDLRGLGTAARDEELRRLAAGEARRPFDLVQGPVLRMALVRLDEQENALLLGLHHIATDGWSQGLLVREMTELYTAFQRGEASPLAELPIQYADFAVWQRSWLAGDALDAEVQWWRGQLASYPSVLALPTDRPRPAVQDTRGQRCSLRLSAQAAAQLGALGRRTGATLFMLLLGTFGELLHRYSGQKRLIVGSPVAGRGWPEVEPLIGFFANTLALPCDLSGSPSLAGLTGRVRESTLRMLAHQHLPFEKLVEVLEPERDLSRTPVFQVMLALQNAPQRDLELPGLTLEELGAGSAAGAESFDFFLQILEGGEGLELSLSYQTALFDRATMVRLLTHFEQLLTAAGADPDLPLAAVPMLTPAETSQLEACSHVPAVPGDEGLCLHELFFRQAARTPDAVALVSAGEELSYAELAGRVSRLAEILSRRGVGPEVPVGICLGREPSLIVALLAVLAAGGMYVPLDPVLPAGRRRRILADCGARLVVTDSPWDRELDGWKLLLVSRPEREDGPAPALHPPSPANGAYVLYTSGSTGRPKGVVVEHRNAVGLVRWGLTVFRPVELAGVLAATSVGFDVSVFEIFAPLSAGHRIYLAANALELRSVAARGEVTWLSAVPSVLVEMLRGGDLPPSVRIVAAGGEPLYRSLAERVLEQPTVGRLFNLYGPTETTTYATLESVERGLTGQPTIGRPAPGFTVDVLDNDGRRVPAGVQGEIVLSGPGLARGYLGRPDLTADRFVPDPLGRESGRRVYRTGDLGRFRPDGRIEYLGRSDHQVKIRGVRIELAEVESALLDHPAVAEAVAVVQHRAGDGQPEGGDGVLAAYVVPRSSGAVDAGELRAFLQETLPGPMVPSSFVFVDDLPRTSSGKADRTALPAWPVQAETKPAGPLDETAGKLALLWQSLLDVDGVGPEDNFFDLGGHSMLALRLIERIDRDLGVRLPLAVLFQAQTLEQLAQVVRSEAGPEAAGRTAPLLVPLEDSGTGRPLFLVHSASGSVLSYARLARLLGREHRVFGLQAPESGAGLGSSSLEEIATAYLVEVRAAQPEGPWLLAGWSLGAVIAYEMARQFEKRGGAVTLVLLDPPPPHDAVPSLDEAAAMAAFAADLAGTAGSRWRPDEAALRAVDDGLRAARVLAEGQRAGALPQELSPERFQALFSIFARHLEALRRYTDPLPFRGRPWLVRAEGSLRQGGGDPAFGWERLASGGIECRIVAADHYSLLRDPTAVEVARLLTAASRRQGETE